MLRIHFGSEDVARTTLRSEPDLLWELLLSLHMLQVGDGQVAFGSWRQRMRRTLPRELLGPLTTLAPPIGYSPDFLTPATDATDVDEAVDAVLSTPKERIRIDIGRLATRSVPCWLDDLAAGRPQTVQRLAHSMRWFHRLALEPYWWSIAVAVETDHRWRRSQLADHGVRALLESVGPDARWRDGVLEIGSLPDEELTLDGRGLRLQPSYFCWQQPIKLMDPELPPVLVFPVRHATGLMRSGQERPDTAGNLVALLGRTRAKVLERIASGASTTQIAVHCRISPAAASQQTAVLREAGLVMSIRQGRFVRHTATALGQALLAGLEQ